MTNIRNILNTYKLYNTSDMISLSKIFAFNIYFNEITFKLRIYLTFKT